MAHARVELKVNISEEGLHASANSNEKGGLEDVSFKKQVSKLLFYHNL